MKNRQKAFTKVTPHSNDKQQQWKGIQKIRNLGGNNETNYIRENKLNISSFKFVFNQKILIWLEELSWLIGLKRYDTHNQVIKFQKNKDQLFSKIWIRWIKRWLQFLKII